MQLNGLTDKADGDWLLCWYVREATFGFIGLGNPFSADQITETGRTK